MFIIGEITSNIPYIQPLQRGKNMQKFMTLIMAIMTTVMTGCALIKTQTETSPKYTEDKPLRVLMVGNSFSLSCEQYLPKVAASVPDCALKLEIAYIGGCSLERHVKEYRKSAEDPEYKPYKNLKRDFVTLQELLAADQWDIISIQQASHFSWDYTSYQPWADELIAIIKESNPQAEIVIQQTWSYNAGDTRIGDLQSPWKFDQEGMYLRLTDAYLNLSQKTGFRIIPVGLAVQYTRDKNPKQFPLDKTAFIQELDAKYPVGEKLPYSDDAVGSIYRNSKEEISFDTIHLNTYGKYLQACVWFSALFNRPVEDIAFIPEELPDKERLQFYRECAAQAVKNK